MSLPIAFARRSPNYEFVAPFINQVSHTAIVTGASMSVGAITYLALQVLGMDATITSLLSAVATATSFH